MDRKLEVGGTLSQAFSIYGSQAGVLLPLAFGLFLAVAVVGGLLASISWVFVVVVIALSVIANTLYQGMVVTLVSDVQDGRRDSSVGDLVNAASPVILPLFLAGLLAGIGIGVGFLLLIVPGLILLTIWAVIAPAIVLERTGVIGAFGRSRELVRGNGWQVFGVIVCVFLVVFVVRAILGAVSVGIADTFLMRAIFDLLASTLTAPVVALVASVLYFQLKGLEEGGAASSPTPPVDPGPATV